MQRLINIIVLLTVSTFLVLASLFWPVTILKTTRDIRAAVELGLPIPFVTQWQNLPFCCPQQTRLYSLWENPVQPNLLIFLLDVGIVFIILSLVVNVGKTIFHQLVRR